MPPIGLTKYPNENVAKVESKEVRSLPVRKKLSEI